MPPTRRLNFDPLVFVVGRRWQQPDLGGDRGSPAARGQKRRVTRVIVEGCTQRGEHAAPAYDVEIDGLGGEAAVVGGFQWVLGVDRFQPVIEPKLRSDRQIPANADWATEALVADDGRSRAARAERVIPQD